MNKLMGLFRPSEIIGIANETLQFVQDAAADTHPNEYMGLLRGENAENLGVDTSGMIITDILVIPGTSSNNTSASMKSSMIPNDTRSLGSVHSHPSGVLTPSDTDRNAFRSGKIHIILGAPYGPDDWQAFDSNGDKRDLRVLDVDLPTPDDFFDFSEADLDIH